MDVRTISVHVMQTTFHWIEGTECLIISRLLQCKLHNNISQPAGWSVDSVGNYTFSLYAFRRAYLGGGGGATDCCRRGALYMTAYLLPRCVHIRDVIEHELSSAIRRAGGRGAISGKLHALGWSPSLIVFVRQPYTQHADRPTHEFFFP